MTQDSKLPDGWQMAKFGDLVRNVREAEHDPLVAGLERYVGLEHIEPENLHIKRWGLIAEGTSFTRKFVKGQVLFGKRRAYQRKVAVAEFDGVCSGDILAFEPKDDRLLPELLPFIVQSEGFFTNALRTSSGSLSPRTRWRDLAVYEFPLPPLDEQRRIAEILWAADDVVVNREKVAERLEETKFASLKNLYSKGLKHTKFRDTELGMLPKKWKVVKFSSLFVGDTQNGLYKPKSAYGTGYETVHMGDIFANDVITNSDMQRVKLSEDEINNFGLREGDLLFARRSIVPEGAGKCSLVGQIFEPIAFESSIIRVSLKKELVHPAFLLGWFQSALGRRSMRKIVRWGAITGIAASDLYKMDILLPLLDEQIGIADLLESIDERLDECASARSRDVELRNLLCNSLLAGKHVSVYGR